MKTYGISVPGSRPPTECSTRLDTMNQIAPDQIKPLEHCEEYFRRRTVPLLAHELRIHEDHFENGVMDQKKPDAQQGKTGPHEMKDR